MSPRFTGETEEQYLKGLLRSSLTCVEVLKDLVEGDHVLKKLLPGLPGIEKEIREVIK
jgi:hypothetical protein